ncbi:hypothetical protein [Pararhodospirillum photometricum]|uniref:hypothetical protein n=1 Tax=Pararhodospirillum photometricum TaxID=1084 RepID=UPI00031D6530|nr:hypothetical protein [Pararhodospirillum photometricum]
MLIVKALDASLRDVPPAPPAVASSNVGVFAGALAARSPSVDAVRPSGADASRERPAPPTPPEGGDTEEGSLAAAQALRSVGFVAQTLAEGVKAEGADRPVTSLLRRTAAAVYSFVINAVSHLWGGARPGSTLVMGQEAAGMGIDLEA